MMRQIEPVIKALDDLERIHGELAKIAERVDDSRRNELIQLRRSSATATLQLAQLAESLFLETPTDLTEFRRLYSAMRSAVALHQSDWPAVRLNDIDEQYKQSGRNVIDANRAFVAWLRAHLKALKS